MLDAFISSRMLSRSALGAVVTLVIVLAAAEEIRRRHLLGVANHHHLPAPGQRADRIPDRYLGGLVEDGRCRRASGRREGYCATDSGDIIRQGASVVSTSGISSTSWRTGLWRRCLASSRCSRAPSAVALYGFCTRNPGGEFRDDILGSQFLEVPIQFAELGYCPGVLGRRKGPHGLVLADCLSAPPLAVGGHEDLAGVRRYDLSLLDSRGQGCQPGFPGLVPSFDPGAPAAQPALVCGDEFGLLLHLRKKTFRWQHLRQGCPGQGLETVSRLAKEFPVAAEGGRDPADWSIRCQQYRRLRPAAPPSVVCTSAKPSGVSASPPVADLISWPILCSCCRLSGSVACACHCLKTASRSLMCSIASPWAAQDFQDLGIPARIRLSPAPRFPACAS